MRIWKACSVLTVMVVARWKKKARSHMVGKEWQLRLLQRAPLLFAQRAAVPVVLSMMWIVVIRS